MTTKPYDVEINGVKTTLLLSDEDAKREGLLKSTKADKAEADEKAKTPANKSRTPANKRAGAASKAFGSKADG